MCLILLALNQHPDYPLIVAANRDEYYQRPTATARPWTQHPDIIAGQDLLQGGTWLGITRTGRFAAVTNVRTGNTEANPQLLSRGLLSRDFLREKSSPEAFLSALEKKSGQYPPFNLLVASGDSMHYFSNRTAAGDIQETLNQQRQLPPGLYGLSNAQLNTAWPKLERAKSRLAAICRQPQPNINDLLELLQDRYSAPDHQLPNTGVSIEWERLLAPGFIQSRDYGTRASTVIRVHQDGTTELTEQSFDNSGSTERVTWRVKREAY